MPSFFSEGCLAYFLANNFMCDVKFWTMETFIILWRCASVGKLLWPSAFQICSENMQNNMGVKWRHNLSENHKVIFHFFHQWSLCCIFCALHKKTFPSCLGLIEAFCEYFLVLG